MMRQLDRLAMWWIDRRRLPPRIGTPGLAVSACIVFERDDHFAVYPMTDMPLDRVRLTALNCSQIMRLN